MGANRSFWGRKKLQARPTACSSFFHAASDLQITSAVKMLCRGFKWWSVACTGNWAASHSFASQIALVTVFRAEKFLFWNSYWFLVFHMAHMIQGARDPFPRPTGGRTTVRSSLFHSRSKVFRDIGWTHERKVPIPILLARRDIGKIDGR